MSLYLGLVVVILVVVLIWLLRLPRSYVVERRQRFAQSADTLYQYVQDYPRWSEWSPWILHDASTQLSYHGTPNAVGSGYVWASAKIGEGSITTTALEPGRSVAMDLRFLKPFKSQADVRFSIEAVDGGCEVAWIMSSGLPIFMRPFCAMFQRMIGMDFELGLARMVGALDPTAPHPRIRFEGVCERAPQAVATQAYSGTIAGLVAFMRSNFPQLLAQVGSHANGAALVAYHKADLKNDHHDCDIAIPVNASYQGAGQKTLAGGRFYKVVLQGDYRFLGATWNAAMGHVRMEKFKYDKSRASLEVYANDMGELPNSNDWLTEIYIPIR